jgi:hypothetical protein
MSQKVSTGLGTAILLIMAFTAGYFVWIIEKDIQQPTTVAQFNGQRTPPLTKIDSMLGSKSDELVYSSKDFKYSFAYPKMRLGAELCLYEDYVDSITQDTYLDISMNCPQPTKVHSGDFSFNTVVSIKISPWSGSLKDFVKARRGANTSGIELTMTGPTVINGNETYVLRCPESKSVEEEMSVLCNDAWFMKNTDYVFEVRGSMDDTEPLLKTMKFIDSIANEMVDSTKIEFDGCGKADKYSSEAWYRYVVSRLGELKQSEAGIFDVCQSLDKSLVIILTNGGGADGLIPYCEAGSLFQYSVENKTLSQAKIDDRGRGCVAWPSEFGKRSGTMISLQGFGGDAGCRSTMYYDYDFIRNVVELKKECDKCEGEKAETCSESFRE